jgi:hypothetical protein
VKALKEDVTMARTERNSALKGISGGIDNWIYRQRNGRTVIASRPTVVGIPTEAQLAVRERFRLAADYARAAVTNPAERAIYAPIAKEKGLSLFTVILTDYLKQPTVSSLDLSGYIGQVGDQIWIRASDDVGVTAVRVAIRAYNEK